MVYGLASFGVSLNYFYCCGSLETVAISNQKVQEAQDHCPMKGEKGCCENKVVSHKISVDQNIPSVFIYEPLLSTTALLPVPFYEAVPPIHNKTIRPEAYKQPPPLLSTHLAFLSVFRI